VLLRYSAVTWG